MERPRWLMNDPNWILTKKYITVDNQPFKIEKVQK
jgi:hypothetical protein